MTHINTNLMSCSTVITFRACLGAPAWPECPGLAVLFHTLFACRHQTLITLHPGSANWLVSLVHIETPLLESFQCPTWRLLGSSLPWASAPCVPDWVLAQPYSDWTWHGDRKQGIRAIEIKEQRWESEVGRDRDTGRWVWEPRPLWQRVCPSTQMSISQEPHVTMMERQDHSHQSFVWLEDINLQA